MNRRDIWLVGLLALAYIYLDSATPTSRRTAAPASWARPPADEDGAIDSVAFDDPDACPRDLSHPVSLRADGAKWCLTCDEGFYPAVMAI